MFPPSVLTTRRLRLRPFTPADAGEVHSVWQDERYVRTAPVGYQFCNADLATAVEWCTNGAERHRREGKGVSFAVEPQAPTSLSGADGPTSLSGPGVPAGAGAGRLAGHVAFFGTNWDDGVAEIHYWTAPWARGQGYAAESARAAARWALTEVGLSRITLLAAEDNAASRHVATSAGFTFEGLLRSAAPARTGGRLNLALYSMIKTDLPPATGPIPTPPD